MTLSTTFLPGILIILASLSFGARAHVTDHERATVLAVLAVAHGLNDIEDAHFDSHRKVEAAQMDWIADHYVAVNSLTDLTNHRNWFVEHPVLDQALVRFHAQLERMLYNTPRNATLFALQYHFQMAFTRAIAELKPAENLLESEPLIHHSDKYHRAVVDDLRSLLQVLTADKSQIVNEDSTFKIVLPFNAYAIRNLETQEAKPKEDGAEPDPLITYTIKDAGLEKSAHLTANAIRSKQALLKHIRAFFDKLKPILDLAEPQYIDQPLVRLMRSIALLQHAVILDSVVDSAYEQETLAQLDMLYADTRMAIKLYTMNCPAGLSAPAVLRR